MISAAEKECQGGEECNFLDAQSLKATYMQRYILPIEVTYFRFQAFTVV
jgi:hypothetical protein